MSVTLVHRTDGAEALIAMMARVSNPANQNNNETAPRLIRYMLREGHWSPFQMANMCVRIETERDIAAQILRHQSFTGFQEFSTRYARSSMAEIPHFRRQDNTNRQSSFDDYSEQEQLELGVAAAEVISKSYSLYYKLLQQGVARETARRILPLCTPTTIYANASLRTWIHYITVRTNVATQLEHRLIAEECKRIFAIQFPVIAEAAFGQETETSVDDNPDGI
jgi:thymidylate synthase (FAD)